MSKTDEADAHPQLMQKIEKSPACAPPFPNLELWAGSEGDVCRSDPNKNHEWIGWVNKVG